MDDKTMCIFCKHCLNFGKGQLRCRLSGAPVEANDWCPRGVKPGLQRPEDEKKEGRT